MLRLQPLRLSVGKIRQVLVVPQKEVASQAQGLSVHPEKYLAVLPLQLWSLQLGYLAFAFLPNAQTLLLHPHQKQLDLQQEDSPKAHRRYPLAGNQRRL